MFYERESNTSSALLSLVTERVMNESNKKKWKDKREFPPLAFPNQRCNSKMRMTRRDWNERPPQKYTSFLSRAGNTPSLRLFILISEKGNKGSPENVSKCYHFECGCKLQPLQLALACKNVFHYKSLSNN